MAKEKPILFNGDMVRAILDGRKTQTRRPVDRRIVSAWDEPRGQIDIAAGYPFVETSSGFVSAVKLCPFGQPGERLWVRETWRVDGLGRRAALETRMDSPSVVEGLSFRADCEFDHGLQCGPWIPSIHMPRWACRIVLEITNIRVERVQDIFEDDAIADGGLETMVEDHIWYIPGADSKTTRDPKYAFEHVWDSIYSARGLGWDVNPWVWVVEFKKVNQ